MSASEPPIPVLVSACLLGRECRYDGGSNRDRTLERELEAQGLRAVAFCPEEHGGLGTPRPPASIEKASSAAVLDGLAAQARAMTSSSRVVTRPARSD